MKVDLTPDQLLIIARALHSDIQGYQHVAANLSCSAATRECAGKLVEEITQVRRYIMDLLLGYDPVKDTLESNREPGSFTQEVYTLSNILTEKEE